MKKKFIYFFITFISCVIAMEITLTKFPDILPSNLKRVLFRRENIKKYGMAELNLCTLDSLLEHRYRQGLDVYLSGHPDFSYRVKTIGLFADDDIGFRDDGIDKPYYGVALGDSFTWGVGVGQRDIWVEKLEKRLDRDIVDMGYSSRFGSTQELRLFEKYGLRINPQLVLWQFFLNDYYENVLFRKWEISGEKGKLFKRESDVILPKKRLENLRGFLEKNSIFYRMGKWWIRKKIFHDKNYLEPRGVKFQNESLDYVFHAWMFEEADLRQARIKEGCRLTQESIRHAYELCQELGANLIVIIVPTKEQAAWKFAGPSLFGDKFVGLNADEPNQIIEKFCQENSISCLNLTASFRRKTEEGEQLYYREDGHWNEKGHQLAADKIYEFLVSRDIIR